MGFTDAIRTCFDKYATFSGRASRSEYWWFVLFFFLSYLVAVTIDMSVLGFDPGEKGSVGWLSSLFSLAVLLPSLAVAIRRLHDKDKSGWWYLLVFIPLIGSIILLLWFVTKGTDGPNRFGADPLAPGHE